jgi:hypothetical protein
MTDLEGYKFGYRQEEERLLAERRKLLDQKQLVDHVFTTDAARKRADLEKTIAEIERRITAVRRILGDEYRNN